MRDLQKHVTELRLTVATNAGAQTATAWWATVVAALIAAWLGLTSIWHIPSLVRQTASGKAQREAESAAQEAKANATAIAGLRESFADAAGPIRDGREGCFALGEAQVCWGTKTITARNSSNRQVIDFDFSYKEFAAPPSIATGIIPGGTG